MDTVKMVKVKRATIWTCKDYAVASLSNELERSEPRHVFEGGDHISIMKALKAFATSRERCKLVLELDDGREIGLIPTLQESDNVHENPIHFAPKWDLSIEV